MHRLCAALRAAGFVLAELARGSAVVRILVVGCLLGVRAVSG